MLQDGFQYTFPTLFNPNTVYFGQNNETSKITRLRLQALSQPAGS